MKRLIVENLSKTYEKQVLFPCSFVLNQKETLAVMGPSGSGKSTLIKGIAKLIDVDGTIEFENIHRVVMVFDEMLCLNHMTVAENISLGMKKEGYTAEEIETRILEVAKQVEISEFLEKTPDQLSFGQKQRMSVDRALVRDFEVLLMDEPFSNLDILLRKQMLQLIRKLQEEKEFLCVYVTHNHKDAQILSDLVLILKDGQIEMMDSYQNCLDHPANEFVKAFLE